MFIYFYVQKIEYREKVFFFGNSYAFSIIFW